MPSSGRWNVRFPDLQYALLSDVHMPENSRHELEQWAAVAQPTIRWVLMSAIENDTGCGDCPYLTGCNLLSKPFNPANAVALVENVLQEPWDGACGCEKTAKL